MVICLLCTQGEVVRSLAAGLMSKMREGTAVGICFDDRGDLVRNPDAERIFLVKILQLIDPKH